MHDGMKIEYEERVTRRKVMATKKKTVAKKKVAALKKKKVVKRKVVTVKSLGKTVTKPKSTKPKRIQTATGWRRMMIKAKGTKTSK